jgi:hypothetical protein
MSLAGCYALLAALAALFLVYAHLSLVPHPVYWSGQVHDSIHFHSFTFSDFLGGARSAAYTLRDRMHNTWFFFSFFVAVWLTALLWMLVERRRRKLSFGPQEVSWMGWISLSVFSTAVLYGLGTNGLLARRFPRAVTVSDALAIGFVLALPVVAWSRLQRQRIAEASAFEEDTPPSPRRVGLLGLHEDEFSARLIEPSVSLTIPMKVVRVDVPAIRLFHPDAPSEHTVTTMDQLIEKAELPVTSQPIADEAQLQLTATSEPAPHGIAGFRDHLTAMNASWQNIERIGQEVEQWFDQQRQQALRRLEMHPGMRQNGQPLNPLPEFPNEKLAAVDAEWASIRKAALEISRWFGDVPTPEQAK